MQNQNLNLFFLSIHIRARNAWTLRKTVFTLPYNKFILKTMLTWSPNPRPTSMLRDRLALFVLTVPMIINLSCARCQTIGFISCVFRSSVVKLYSSRFDNPGQGHSSLLHSIYFLLKPTPQTTSSQSAYTSCHLSLNCLHLSVQKTYEEDRSQTSLLSVSFWYLCRFLIP